jgi:exosortase/archaeosortase family protein
VAQHQLLVEDACAGLNTLVSLIALCCFYIYAVRPAGLRGAAPLLLAVVPVALLANFMRVILLILITYYFDNEVAQGFIHQGAGLLMALVALAALMGVDVALGRVSGGPR